MGNNLTLEQVIRDINWHIKDGCHEELTSETLKLWVRSLEHYKLNEQPYRSPEGPRHEMGQ